MRRMAAKIKKHMFQLQFQNQNSENKLFIIENHEMRSTYMFVLFLLPRKTTLKQTKNQLMTQEKKFCKNLQSIDYINGGNSFATRWCGGFLRFSKNVKMEFPTHSSFLYYRVCNRRSVYIELIQSFIVIRLIFIEVNIENRISLYLYANF